MINKQKALYIVLGVAVALVVIGLVLEAEALIGPAGLALVVYGAYTWHNARKAKRAMQPANSNIPQNHIPHIPAKNDNAALNKSAQTSIVSENHIPLFEWVTVRGLDIKPSESEYNKCVNQLDKKMEKLEDMVSNACIYSHEGNPRNALAKKQKIEEFLQAIVDFCQIEGEFMIEELNTRIDDINNCLSEFNDYIDNDFEKELAEYTASKKIKSGK